MAVETVCVTAATACVTGAVAADVVLWAGVAAGAAPEEVWPGAVAGELVAVPEEVVPEAAVTCPATDETAPVALEMSDEPSLLTRSQCRARYPRKRGCLSLLRRRTWDVPRAPSVLNIPLFLVFNLNLGGDISTHPWRVP